MLSLSLSKCCLRPCNNKRACSTLPCPSRLLHTPARRTLATYATDQPGEDQQTDTLKADLERFKQRQAAAASPSSSKQEPANGGFKDIVDQLLITDFFIVLGILAWLVTGVAAQTIFNNSSLLDAWYPLWPFVFQPLIGVLMLGALVSGGMGWLAEQQNKN